MARRRCYVICLSRLRGRSDLFHLFLISLFLVTVFLFFPYFSPSNHLFNLYFVLKYYFSQFIYLLTFYFPLISLFPSIFLYFSALNLLFYLFFVINYFCSQCLHLKLLISCTSLPYFFSLCL